MACPTCDHTMYGFGSGVAVWWCPRCGTLKDGKGEEADYHHPTAYVGQQAEHKENSRARCKPGIRLPIAQKLIHVRLGVRLVFAASQVGLPTFWSDAGKIGDPGWAFPVIFARHDLARRMESQPSKSELLPDFDDSAFESVLLHRGWQFFEHDRAWRTFDGREAFIRGQGCNRSIVSWKGGGNGEEATERHQATATAEGSEVRPGSAQQEPGQSGASRDEPHQAQEAVEETMQKKTGVSDDS